LAASGAPSSTDTVFVLFFYPYFVYFSNNPVDEFGSRRLRNSIKPSQKSRVVLKLPQLDEEGSLFLRV